MGQGLIVDGEQAMGKDSLCPAARPRSRAGTWETSTDRQSGQRGAGWSPELLRGDEVREGAGRLC